jgi:hypothetical protein
VWHVYGCSCLATLHIASIRYHRTHSTMISWSKCRPLKRSCADVGSVIPGVMAVHRAFQAFTPEPAPTISTVSSRCMTSVSGTSGAISGPDLLRTSGRLILASIDSNKPDCRCHWRSRASLQVDKGPKRKLPAGGDRPRALQSP